MPKRIQFQRKVGWRMPDNCVFVARPSRWGNPFKWKEGVEVGGEAWAKGAAVDLFREWLARPDRFPKQRQTPSTADIIEHLRGKDLACYCKLGAPCHADVLLSIANSP